MWDNFANFSFQQPLAAGPSTNTFKSGPADIAKGEPVHLVVNVSQGTTGPLTVAVETDDSEDMSGAVDLVTYIIPADKLARGGDVLSAPLPTGCKGFLRLRYAGGSGGTVTAGLNRGGQTNGM